MRKNFAGYRPATGPFYIGSGCLHGQIWWHERIRHHAPWYPCTPRHFTKHHTPSAVSRAHTEHTALNAPAMRAISFMCATIRYHSPWHPLHPAALHQASHPVSRARTDRAHCLECARDSCDLLSARHFRLHPLLQSTLCSLNTSPSDPAQAQCRAPFFIKALCIYC